MREKPTPTKCVLSVVRMHVARVLLPQRFERDCFATIIHPLNVSRLHPISLLLVSSFASFLLFANCILSNKSV